jgi:uridine kinase
LARLVQETLHFDKTLLFETDRYHKWERGAKEYQQFTHLHPAANHLEKLSTDAYNLRLGQDVFQVDYDHSTGKFTEPACVEAKHFTIFCGLHTLYLDSLRDIMDLKIYMDTDANLKEFWKIQRDTKHRGASPEQVRKAIASRIPDFQEYIEPQKANANIWIRFFSSEPENPSALQLQIGVQEELLPPHFQEKMQPFCLDVRKDTVTNVVTFLCNPFVSGVNLTKSSKDEGYELMDLKDSYQGILQYFLILLIWKQSSKNI